MILETSKTFPNIWKYKKKSVFKDQKHFLIFENLFLKK